MTIVDCISDLHGEYPTLEGGDLLIIAGDILTHGDDIIELTENFEKDWLRWEAQKYEKIIIVAGNHDNIFTRLDYYGWSWRSPKVAYLCDSGTEFEGLKIWGSPWTRNFYGQNPKCKAFGLDTETQLMEKFDMIPIDTDILITHMPPHGILDNERNKYLGCAQLRSMLLFRYRLPNLKLHVFGHIHEQGGKMLDTGLTKFVNASQMDGNYEYCNRIVRVIL